MNRRPPRMAEWLLKKLLHDDFFKTMLGDLQEYYQHLVNTKGMWHARAWYWAQVFRYVPSKLFNSFIWTLRMLISYLKISRRSLLKNKSYSFINITGLAVGLACFILIGLFVLHEFSYDTHYKDTDRIYRLIKQNPGAKYLGSDWFGVMSAPVPGALKEAFPQVEYATYTKANTGLIKHNGESFTEEGISAHGDFFEIFNLEWIQGDPGSALHDPESIILTKSLATKFFKDENPMGQTIQYHSDEQENRTKVVTGVVKDVPNTTHQPFDYIISDLTSKGYEDYSIHWNVNNFFAYIKLAEGADLELIRDDMQALYTWHFNTMGYYARNPDRLPILDYQLLRDIHLKSSHLNFAGKNLGDIQYVYTLLLIAIIILLIACVNYMNLATAKAITRAKEVGVRKVIGAMRGNLIMQFISEAIILSLISISLAILIVQAVLPLFSDMVARPISASFMMSLEFWAMIVCISLIVGIIAGSYPAFYMSSLRPAGILKSDIKGGKRNTFIRNALVTGQFAITTILIISSLVIFEQLHFIRSTDTGFSRDQIVVIPIQDEDLKDRYPTIAQNISRHAGVTDIAAGEYLPTNITSRTTGVSWEGKESDVRLEFHKGDINVGYLEIMGIGLLAGESFKTTAPNDTTRNYILNETAIRSMGLTPEEAIGTSFTLWRRKGTIVGVMEDFNYLSFRQPIMPLVLRQTMPNKNEYIFAKVATANLENTLASIEADMKAISPDYPFEYIFLDDAYQNMYETDLRLGSLLNGFTIMALFIASIGLFGLAAFMMEQRSKEIGIRKVLGANLVQIVTLVNRDFIRLLTLSFLIAIPVGWYMMNTWLKEFTYKIELDVSLFLISVIIAISVALCTVSYKSVKTALTNPIDSLRSE